MPRGKYELLWLTKKVTTRNWVYARGSFAILSLRFPLISAPRLRFVVEIPVETLGRDPAVLSRKRIHPTLAITLGPEVSDEEELLLFCFIGVLSVFAARAGKTSGVIVPGTGSEIHIGLFVFADISSMLGIFFIVLNF